MGVYYGIGAKHGGGDKMYDWYTYRYVRGVVDMRVTDITPDYGQTFSYAQILFELRDQNDTHRGSHWCGKNWGVIGPWTRVAVIAGAAGARVRIRSAHSWTIPVQWTADMRYNDVVIS